MNRDNVSEMARVMCGRSKDCLLCPVQSPCLMRNCAELLNAEGYRKADDVRAETITEFKNKVIDQIFYGSPPPWFKEKFDQILEEMKKEI